MNDDFFYKQLKKSVTPDAASKQEDIELIALNNDEHIDKDVDYLHRAGRGGLLEQVDHEYNRNNKFIMNGHGSYRDIEDDDESKENVELNDGYVENDDENTDRGSWELLYEHV